MDRKQHRLFTTRVELGWQTEYGVHGNAETVLRKGNYAAGIDDKPHAQGPRIDRGPRAFIVQRSNRAVLNGECGQTQNP